MGTDNLLRNVGKTTRFRSERPIDFSDKVDVSQWREFAGVLGIALCEERPVHRNDEWMKRAQIEETDRIL